MLKTQKKDYKNEFTPSTLRKSGGDRTVKKNMEHDMNLLDLKISRYLVTLQTSKMKVINQPKGSFSDPGFHVWVTDLGKNFFKTQ